MRLRGRRVSVAASDATPTHYEPPRLLFVVPVLGITQILAWGSSYYLPAVLAAPLPTLARNIHGPTPTTSPCLRGMRSPAVSLTDWT